MKKLVLFCLIVFVFSPLPFTNCAQNPQSAEVPQSAFLSSEDANTSLMVEFSGKTSYQFCDLPTSYGCMKRVYSRTIASENRAPEETCIQGSNFCVHTLVTHFNTQEAQETCDNCDDSFETENFACHLKLANSDGIYPIVEIAEDFSVAIENLQNFCRSVAR